MTTGELQALLNEADEHNNLGDYAEAERLSKEVIDATTVFTTQESPEISKDSQISRDQNETVESEYLKIRCAALNTLSTAEWRTGNLTSAQDTAKHALALTEVHHFPELEARSLATLGIVHARMADNQEALECYKKALAICSTIGTKASQAAILGNIGNLYNSLGDFAQAISYLQSSLSIFEEMNDADGIAKGLGNLGSVYWTQSDYPKALELLSRSLALNQQLDNKPNMAYNLCDIGLVYHELSDYNQAIEYYTAALELHEQFGSRQNTATVLGNIGTVHYDLGDYTRALENYNRSYTIHTEIGDKEGVANDLGGQGNVHQKLTMPDKALEYYNEALALVRTTGNKHEEARHPGNIGSIHRELGKYDDAITYFREALALCEKMDDKRGIAISIGNVGETYGRRDFSGYNPALAEQYLTTALEMTDEVGTRYIRINLHLTLAEVYKGDERWKEAFQQFEKFHELEKEVHNENAKKKVEQLDYERKQTEREKQIAVERARHDTTLNILHKTLPPSIAERLVSGEQNIADRFESVTILFADIVGFTPLALRRSPQEMVQLLNGLFSRFDRVTETYGVERIKTIGDAYMIVAGAPMICDDHAERMANVAFALLETTVVFNQERKENIKLRIGINTGEAIAAVVGETKFSYDLWSDAVNTASRMESHGEAGKIHVSDEFKNAVELRPTSKPLDIRFTQRGEVDIKGKGKMRTYFLEKL